MTIVMKSKPQKVTAVRKTQAQFWKDVKVGDVLVFSQDVKGQGSGRGLYAVGLTITNVTQGTVAVNTMNQATNNMRGFELEEVSE